MCVSNLPIAVQYSDETSVELLIVFKKTLPGHLDRLIGEI